jgi:hypothetical protein
MTNEVKRWIVSLLQASPVSELVNGRFFRFRTGDEVPAPFVVITDVRTNYVGTKGATFVDGYAFVALCVANSADIASAVAEGVIKALDGKFSPVLDRVLSVSSQLEQYDFEQGNFVTNVEFQIL